LLVSINPLESLSKIESQLFRILNFGHCDLPFDLAQGGEVVSLSNHLVFVFCYLKFSITETLTLTPETSSRNLQQVVRKNPITT